MSSPGRRAALYGINGQLLLVEACGEQLGCGFNGELEVPPEGGDDYRSTATQLEVSSGTLGGIYGSTSWSGLAEAMFASQISLLDSFLGHALLADLCMADYIDAQAAEIVVARRKCHVIHEQLLAARVQVNSFVGAGQLVEARALEAATAYRADCDRTAALDTLKAATADNASRMTELANMLGDFSDQVLEIPTPNSLSGVVVGVDPEELRCRARELGAWPAELQAPVHVWFQEILDGCASGHV
ncbi:MAG: hypothetical protein K2Q25_05460 [Mycobacteriaceae bacterium]|nr:hypothetical protein [Mycobacteriaceae bacterium]